MIGSALPIRIRRVRLKNQNREQRAGDEIERRGIAVAQDEVGIEDILIEADGESRVHQISQNSVSRGDPTSR